MLSTATSQKHFVGGEHVRKPALLAGSVVLMLLSLAGVGHSQATSVFGRSGMVIATSGDYTANQVTNAVDSTATYNNPDWLANLAWSKIKIGRASCRERV